MGKFFAFCTSLCALVLFDLASPAHAQIAWVGPTGNDVNPGCTQSAPCATFFGALAHGGISQINCLGSGSYGNLSGAQSITGSLIIDCGAGNVGEVTLGAATSAIQISTGAPANIVLRHLSLTGFGATGKTGINASTMVGGTLIVEDCMISGFGTPAASNGSAIGFIPTGSRVTLQVSNSSIFNNGNGIVASPLSGGIASVMLSGVELTNNFQGLLLGGNVVAGHLSNSLVAANTSYGINAFSNQVFFDVSGTKFINNLALGIFSTSTGVNISVGDSVFSGNGAAVSAPQGSVTSFGNNHMSANAINGNFTGTTPLQ